MIAAVRDAQGHPVAAANHHVGALLDRTVDSYLGVRADTRERLARVLADDPRCVMAHCLDGYLLMISSKRESTAHAREALARGESAADQVQASRREWMHLRALRAWAYGDMRAAVNVWTALLAETPRDIVALRVSQFVLSYLGESVAMRQSTTTALDAWDPDAPGYGFVLGCHAYSLEETGEYAEAEELGRRAVDLNAADIWAAHAVAHVREMQSRLHDGIAWIAALSEQWRECSNFAHHLRWHEALYHLELDDHARVLELYDRAVWMRESDEYLDLANAVSLLWRLEQAEVDVGARWTALADRSRAHIGDHALVFVDLHYVMALAAASGDEAVGQFLESCAQFAGNNESTEARVMTDVGLPLARAVVAHRQGAYGDAVDLLLPVRERIRLIGGSHAQRDLFEQLLIDAAWRARKLDVAAALLAERTAKRPRNVWAWKHRAAVLEAAGASGALDARRTLDDLRRA
jgi:tetratricopeptide (TPR) repeat protein